MNGIPEEEEARTEVTEGGKGASHRAPAIVHSRQKHLSSVIYPIVLVVVVLRPRPFLGRLV
jgi:hypothetical protein